MRASPWTLNNMHRVGLDNWNKLFGPHKDHQAFIRSLYRDDKWEGEVASLFFHLAKWVDGGCRIIDSDVSYFSAMMHTDLHSSAREELRVPWPSFVVRVPRGAISLETHPGYPSDGSKYDVVTLFVSDGAADTIRNFPAMPPQIWCLTGHSDAGFMTRGMSGQNLDDLIFGEEDDFARETYPKETRAIKSALAGLLFTMQHTSNFAIGSRNSGIYKRPLRNEPPPHRSIVIGRPINFRASPNESHGATGAGSTPAFQTMVRGHIKRQVCGMNRTGRKVVWIEPYWRGPEDAPILSRPYMVNS